MISLDGTPVERAHLDLMSDAIAHRGPDDRGLFQAPAVGLIHRRLSIVDLSSAGHGPMPNEDHTLWITYNGEVYNYRELMPDLLARGYRFRSTADTEVILHAYAAYGPRCVERFNGMFAFAIWDAHRGRLFCARDRCGVKPFYFVENEGRLAFASEIKALLTLPWVRATPNPAAVMDYLARGLADHADATFFQDIQVLPAGHIMTVGPGHMVCRQYWSIPSGEDGAAEGRPSAQQRARWDEEFEALLFDSVRLRLRGDVTVGSCLSGGLDSSTIVSMANKLLSPEPGEPPALHESWQREGERQMTFSACYDDPAIDERRYMDAVIARTGVSPRFTYPRGEDLEGQLERIVWHQDEPFLSTSIVAQWEVMKLSRAHGVKVLLDGQGADELLCGYVGYFGPFLADLLAHGRLEDLGRELALFDRNYGDRYGNGRLLLARAIRARHPWLRPALRSRLDPARRLPLWIAPDQAEWVRRESWEPPTGYASAVPGYLPSAAHWLFSHGSLPALLRYEDRNSMAFGIESRVPFLDYRLVEFVFRQPNAFRMEDGLGKRTLRRVARRWVPESVWRRRDKLGFTTPEDRWLRGPARPLITRLLAEPPPSFSHFVAPEAARADYEAFTHGAGGDGTVIWRWVNLALWLKIFVDRPSGVRGPALPSATAV